MKTVKGAKENAGGKIKEVAGRVTGDRKLENEGKVDQVKGAVHSVVGDAKDSVKDMFRRD
ncbi:MAG: CsbD family protein [Edaphobacter sp.]